MADPVVSTNNIVNRLPASQYITQAYANMVGLSDLIDDGGSSLGLGGGIFGGGMYGMGGMGYGPGSERMNMSEIDAMRYDSKIKDYQIHDRVNQQKELEAAEFDSNAAKDVIASKAGVLQSIVKDNDQDSVFSSYKNLREAAKIKLEEAGYTNVTPLQLNAYTSRLYYEATGKKITDDLEEHGDGSFMHGFKQGLGCGLGALMTNKKSVEENISDITGKPETTESKVISWTGRIFAGALTLGAGILLCKRLSNLNFFAKSVKTNYRLFRAGNATSKANKAAELVDDPEITEAASRATTAYGNAQETANRAKATYYANKATRLAGKI